MSCSQERFSAATGVGTVSVANTNRDGTGTLVEIISASGNGTKVNTVAISATGATSAGFVNLFSATVQIII